MSHDLDWAVIVTVTIVRMVQVAVDQVVDVVAVGHCFVATAWAMDMIGRVRSTGMIRSAGCWVIGVDL